MNNDILSLPSLVSPKSEEDRRMSFRNEYKTLNYDYGVEEDSFSNVSKINLNSNRVESTKNTARNTKHTIKVTTAKYSFYFRKFYIV
jgi:hypothetical protein